MREHEDQDQAAAAAETNTGDAIDPAAADPDAEAIAIDDPSWVDADEATEPADYDEIGDEL